MAAKKKTALTLALQKAFKKSQHLYNFWEGSLDQYMEIVKNDPSVMRTSFSRIYDMILSYGTEEWKEGNEEITKYLFFSDPKDNGKDAVYGLERPLMKFMNLLKAATKRYGAEKRVFLFHGPVGSSKSTIVRLIKKGLERYTLLPEGELYSFYWTRVPTHFKNGFDGDLETIKCPMHEEPMHIIPLDSRDEFVKTLFKVYIDYRATNELCPTCRQIYRELIKLHEGDIKKVLEHITVYKLFLSEKDRIGIGTFQPKDEKNQDSTELTGDINYNKIAIYGSDSDPRAFSFDGEFNIANRGIVEFIEVLKLDVAFLYDLLGASQEHKIKPKKFQQTDIDEVIIGHTNEPEYKKLQSNDFMEALRDRTVKIDIPYITKLSDEIKIYEKDYNTEKIKGKHIAPHTIETAAMWAVLTRLEDPKKATLSKIQKMKLYNGKVVPGYSEKDVQELKLETSTEGLEGISPRYVQDKISNALVKDDKDSQQCVNPFTVMNELEEGLAHHSLINDETQKQSYREMLAMVKEEYTDIVKQEVQRAIAADEDGIKNLFGNYIDHVKSYTQKEKVKNKYTGEDEEPDERLMRSIEEKIDIPESRKDDFRREIMNFIAARSLEGKTFEWDSNEKLQRALELKLFEDRKDSIKLSTLVSSVVDKETQEKIDIVKTRLIDTMGYCDVCATDVLNFVASIFARGDIKSKEQ